MKNTLRIHICIVGYEIDRISHAAMQSRADKVYLISQEKNDIGRWAVEANRNILTDNKIEVEVMLIDNIKELDQLVGAIFKIAEKEKNNLIYINISSNGKLGSIAGMMAAMMKSKQIIPYYVAPLTYMEEFSEGERTTLIHQYGGLPRSKGIKSVDPILTFPVLLPKPELISALKFIGKNKEVTKSELIEFCKEDEGLKRMREGQQNIRSIIKKSKQEKPRDYAWLNQNIIEKLDKDWGFIEIEKKGKISLIKLNKEGERILHYLSNF